MIAKGIPVQELAKQAIRLQRIGRRVSDRFHLMLDLPGGKPRFALVHPTQIDRGERIRLLLTGSESLTYDHKSFFTENLDLHAASLKKGQRMTVADGELVLTVIDKDQSSILCYSSTDYTLEHPRSINLVDSAVSYGAVSEQDITYLKGFADVPFDSICISMVNSPHEIATIRSERDLIGLTQPLVAKIETSEAVDNLPGIAEAVDGLMVARGDLSCELPMADLPKLQHLVLNQAARIGRTVYVATGLLSNLK